MVYVVKYGAGNLGNRVGRQYNGVSYNRFRNAVNAGYQVYQTGKAINQGLRSLKQSTPVRSHPRDWLKKSVSPKMTPRSKTRLTTRMKRGAGAFASHSAGFLKTRRKSRKPKGWQAGKGVTMTFETGGVLGNQDIVYVGHATGPRDRIFEQCSQTMLKLLMTKMNIRIRDFDAPLSEIPIPATSQFRFTYKLNASTATTTVDTYIVGAADTFNNVAFFFSNLWAGSTNYSEVMPLTFAYVGDGGIQNASIALEALMFHFDIKSSLKLQNRSINSAGNDQVDEVDNVPLYGKSIGGTGTGVQARFPSSTSPANIFGSLSNGLISKVTIDVNSTEPLSGYFWPKSSQQGKIHIDPGQLKTSVLSTKRSISLKLMLKMFSTAPVNNTGLIASFGKYRFFQLEKMIDTGVAINLLVAYELNTSMSCYATTKYNWTTAPVYRKQA